MARREQSIAVPADPTADEIAAKKVALQNANSDVAYVGTQINDMKIQLATMTSDFEDRKAAAQKDLDDFIASAAVTKEALSNDIDELNALKSKAVSDSSAVSNSLTDLSSQAQAIKDSNISLQATADTLKATRDGIASDIASKNSELTTIQGSIKSASDTLDSINEGISDKNSILSGLDTQIDQANKALVSVNASISDRQSQNNALQTDIDALIIKKRDLVDVINLFQADYDTKKSDLDAREQAAISREQSASTLIENLNHRIEIAKNMQNISDLKNFLNEVVPLK